MGMVSDILDTLRSRGLLRGGWFIVGRLRHRTLHSAWLALDLCRAFWRGFRYLRESRRSGRRLVCITLIEHMGDIVACEPVARQVRGEEQDALIVWCAKSDYVQIIALFPEIDGFIPVRCLTSWIALRRWARFDRIVDLHINGRTCLTCRIPLRKHEGDLRISLENYYHHGSLLASFSLSAGLPALVAGPVLRIPDEVAQRVNRFGLPDRTVVIHCCSNESCRDWEASHWRQLIDALHGRYGVTIVEIGARSTLERPDSTKYRNLCGKCSILESAELIKRALLFVGVDSGPAHLANAVATFGVILLGDYLSFRHYTPYSGAYADGSGAVLLRAHGEASFIQAAEVIDAVAGRLAPILGQEKTSNDFWRTTLRNTLRTNI